MTKHMPTEPVFFNALAGDTNIPDPTKKKIVHCYKLRSNKSRLIHKFIFVIYVICNNSPNIMLIIRQTALNRPSSRRNFTLFGIDVIFISRNV